MSLTQVLPADLVVGQQYLLAHVGREQRSEAQEGPGAIKIVNPYRTNDWIGALRAYKTARANTGLNWTEPKASGLTMRNNPMARGHPYSYRSSKNASANTGVEQTLNRYRKKGVYVGRKDGLYYFDMIQSWGDRTPWAPFDAYDKKQRAAEAAALGLGPNDPFISERFSLKLQLEGPEQTWAVWTRGGPRPSGREPLPPLPASPVNRGSYSNGGNAPDEWGTVPPPSVYTKQKIGNAPNEWGTMPAKTRGGRARRSRKTRRNSRR